MRFGKEKGAPKWREGGKRTGYIFRPSSSDFSQESRFSSKKGRGEPREGDIPKGRIEGVEKSAEIRRPRETFRSARGL